MDHGAQRVGLPKTLEVVGVQFDGGYGTIWVHPERQGSLPRLQHDGPYPVAFRVTVAAEGQEGFVSAMHFPLVVARVLLKLPCTGTQRHRSFPARLAEEVIPVRARCNRSVEGRIINVLVHRFGVQPRSMHGNSDLGRNDAAFNG
jgi:hypothetical protein